MVADTTQAQIKTSCYAGRRRVVLASANLLLVFFTLCFLVSGTLAETTGKIVATKEDGFGRIVFNFETLPKYKIKITTGVLVVAFDEPVDLDPNKVAINLSEYIGAARSDPDQRAVRFALTQSMSVNSMEAGDQLFVDLLPADWTGMPPGLPQDVVARLARRAELAEAKARREALEAAARENAAIIEVQAGQYQTFSRISFNWNQPFESKVARDGDKVLITFNKLARIDLDALNASKPNFLSSISSSLTDRGLVLELGLADGAAVRAFQDGRSYIVDLSPNGGGLAGLDNSGPLGGDGDEIRLSAQPTENQFAAGEEQPAWYRRNQSTITTDHIPFKPQDWVPRDYGDWSGSTMAVSAQGTAGPVGASSNTESSSGSPAANPAILSADDVDIVVADATEVPVVSKRNARNVDVTFKFPEAVRAAVFQRGNVIWSVFDSDVPINLGTLEADLVDRLEEATVTRSGAMQYVRLKLRGPALTSVAGKNRLWTISIGDMPTEPTIPLTIGRALAEDGLPQVIISIDEPGTVHWIDDKELGDRLAVVTAYGPARGLVKQQHFVEFTIFPSAHGIALSPMADDLRVSSEFDQVIIERKRGLWLSAADGLADVATRDIMGEARPGFIDFARFREGGTAAYLRNRQKYEHAVSVVSGDERSQALTELAQFYLAHMLASEATAILTLAGQNTPALIKTPTYNALMGIAQTMMWRPADALKYFSMPGLAQGREIELWRGLLEASKGNWSEAKRLIEAGEHLLWAYPSELRARFISAGARSALEINDLGAANHFLAVMEDVESSKHIEAEIALLRGRYLVALGQTTAGLALFDAAVDSGVRPVEVEARFQKLALMQDSGSIETVPLIAQLENLSMSWRGGSFELKTLQRLSDLYAEEDRFRDLFEVMKTASRLSFDSDVTRQIQDKIAVSFRELFLGDHADVLSPIEALSLFYDHRVLTPVGRQGDELIRRLAERLIDVDLLDQAAELLSHQVDNRLTGSARAQVAAQLALVHLMNRNPVDAVKVLNRTQIAGIPNKVQRQRNILKARALADAGRMELALDILDTMIGDDIEVQKADILWQAKAWQEAAEQFERVLGDSWKQGEALDEQQRRNAMRSAISYSLAGDQLGLDRLRSKFSQKMSEGPEARAFLVVTNPVADRGQEFRELAREIASVDTLESFLEDFRSQQNELEGGGSDQPQG